ncbi:MAG: SPFH domain-containing protein, partial [Candidatus Eisenbacteria bacterium]
MMPVIVVAFVLLFILGNSVRVYREYERAVVFRLGRLQGARGPGIILLIPIVDRPVKVSLRMVVLDVPTQDVITKDNVSVKVNAVVYFRVMDPNKAITDVENYMYATSQLSQTTLRSVLGTAELDDLLANRQKINSELQTILDRHTDPWGIKV